MKLLHSLFLAPVLMPLAVLAAAESAKPAIDPDLPQPFDPSALAAVSTSSPFTRMVNMSDNLVLTGIAYIDGKPVATIFNKETKQSYIVSAEPNFQGWVLNEALPAPDITRSRAVVTIGGEKVKLNYAAITAEDMKGGKKEKSSERSDRGPPPGGERFRGESRGPSEEDRKRYESLSDKAKEKVREMFRSKFADEKFRNAPEEERRNMIRREVERIEKEDKGGR